MELWIGSVALSVLGIVAHLAQDHASSGRLIPVFRCVPTPESAPTAHGKLRLLDAVETIAATARTLVTGTQGGQNMIDPYQVLREKEKEVERLRLEIDALRLVMPILDEGDAIEKGGASQVSVSRLRPTGTDDALSI
jgi:hypothetical protein